MATPNFNFLIHLALPEKSALEEKYIEWNMNTFLSGVKRSLKNNDALKFSKRNENDFILNDNKYQFFKLSLYVKRIVQILEIYIG